MDAPRSPAEWARSLRAVAAGAPRAGPSPFAVDALMSADLAGDRRVIDARPSEPADPQIDLVLWRAVAGLGPAPALPAGGPLAPHLRALGIEFWTETELSALHALDALTRRTHDAVLASRRDSAAEWLLAEIQPDNATHFPWAVQVFIGRWCTHADGPSLLYAQSQIHACRVSAGVPDARSALILRHAAMLLDALPGQE